jgi:hypothetical protein
MRARSTAIRFRSMEVQGIRLHESGRFFSGRVGGVDSHAPRHRRRYKDSARCKGIGFGEPNVLVEEGQHPNGELRWYSRSTGSEEN